MKIVEKIKSGCDPELLKNTSSLVSELGYIISDISKKWPEIKEEYEDEIHDFEPLDCENFEIISVTDDTIVMCAGGDWQLPHKVTISLVDDELTVTACKKSKYQTGLSENILIDIFK